MNDVYKHERSLRVAIFFCWFVVVNDGECDAQDDARCEVDDEYGDAVDCVGVAAVGVVVLVMDDGHNEASCDHTHLNQVHHEGDPVETGHDSPVDLVGLVSCHVDVVDVPAEDGVDDVFDEDGDADEGQEDGAQDDHVDADGGTVS